MIIRRAVPGDAAALAALKLAAFRETFIDGFAIPYPPADLAIFEQASYGPAQVTSELTDPLHRSWVVDDAAPSAPSLVAYAHIGPCELPHPQVQSGEMELYQLYVLARAQGYGLGGWLLDVALQAIAAHGGAAWLGVWRGNVRAGAFYANRGFEIVGEYQFAVGEWRDDENIMRRAG